MTLRNKFFTAAIAFIFPTLATEAQTLVFHEDFEMVDSMFSSGTPAWFQENAYSTDGTHCIRDTVGLSSTAYLVSEAFSTMGNNQVYLYFDQICKISFANQAYVDVSNDNGNTWTTLSGINYLGASTYFPIYNYFSSFSYGSNGWDAAHNATLPQNSWWRSETFDISMAGNSSQVKIRFRLVDASGIGNLGNYGWLIDHVHVNASPNELTLPYVAWAPPFIQGRVYSQGPFVISDTMTDVSGIGNATLYYSINGGTYSSVAMSGTGNIYQGIIPTLNANDTVCYYVVGSDIWGNETTLPPSGCINIISCVATTLPFTDNFETANVWETTTASGSSWEHGTPNYGVTTGAHSPTDAWDVALNSTYLPGSTAHLTSPVFSFLNITNARISFWRNHNVEDGYDGMHLECTTNGTNWWTLGKYFDPRGTNWYNYQAIFSSPTPAFSGNSNGWIQSTYILDTLNNNPGPVQFRFVFTSDQSVSYDGFSIDDFSLSISPAGIMTQSEQQLNLKIYPNPSTGIFYFNYEPDRINNSVISIEDVFGNEIWKNDASKPGLNIIDLSSRSNGVYFVSVKTGFKTQVEKIVVCK